MKYEKLIICTYGLSEIGRYHQRVSISLQQMVFASLPKHMELRTLHDTTKNIVNVGMVFMIR